MQQVLQALQDNGLVIHAEKCVWGVPELEYLDHKTSAAGVLPFPSHMGVIQEFPRHSIIKKLQAFLGMVNFYSRFLSSIACTLRPLTDELRGGKKGTERLEWSLGWMLLLHVQSKQCFVQLTWSTLQWGQSYQWLWMPRRH